MESVRKAKQRLRQYPTLVAKCSKEATDYATCVLKANQIQINACKEEFGRFKRCLQKSAVGLKTKL